MFFNKLKGSKRCSLIRFFRNLTKKDSVETWECKICLIEKFAFNWTHSFWVFFHGSGFIGRYGFRKKSDADPKKKNPDPKHWKSSVPYVPGDDPLNGGYFSLLAGGRYLQLYLWYSDGSVVRLHHLPGQVSLRLDPDLNPAVWKVLPVSLYRRA